MTLDPAVFKAYDVRGIYPTELDEAKARQIGLAFQFVLDDADRALAELFRRDERRAVVAAIAQPVTEAVGDPHGAGRSLARLRADGAVQHAGDRARGAQGRPALAQ